MFGGVGARTGKTLRGRLRSPWQKLRTPGKAALGREELRRSFGWYDDKTWRTAVTEWQEALGD